MRSHPIISVIIFLVYVTNGQKQERDEVHDVKDLIQPSRKTVTVTHISRTEQINSGLRAHITQVGGVPITQTVRIADTPYSLHAQNDLHSTSIGVLDSMSSPWVSRITALPAFQTGSQRMSDQAFVHEHRTNARLFVPLVTIIGVATGFLMGWYLYGRATSHEYIRSSDHGTGEDNLEQTSEVLLKCDDILHEGQYSRFGEVPGSLRRTFPLPSQSKEGVTSNQLFRSTQCVYSEIPLSDETGTGTRNGLPGIPSKSRDPDCEPYRMDKMPPIGTTHDVENLVDETESSIHTRVLSQEIAEGNKFAKIVTRFMHMNTRAHGTLEEIEPLRGIYKETGLNTTNSVLRPSLLDQSKLTSGGHDSINPPESPQRSYIPGRSEIPCGDSGSSPSKTRRNELRRQLPLFDIFIKGRRLSFLQPSRVIENTTAMSQYSECLDNSNAGRDKFTTLPTRRSRRDDAISKTTSRRRQTGSRTDSSNGLAMCNNKDTRLSLGSQRLGSNSTIRSNNQITL